VENCTRSFTVVVDFIPSSVKANGKMLAWEFDEKRNEVKVQALPGPVELLIER